MNDRFRQMNQAMVARLIDEQADPIPEAGYGLRVLEVAGRHSGRPTRTPIGVLHFRGGRYLVCPDRSRDWPQNLRHAGWGTIMAGDVSEPVDAVQIDGTDAAEVVAAYLAAVTAPWAVAAFDLPAHATIEEIVPALTRMAVFRLTSVAAGGVQARVRG